MGGNTKPLRLVSLVVKGGPPWRHLLQYWTPQGRHRPLLDCHWNPVCRKTHWRSAGCFGPKALRQPSHLFSLALVPTLRLGSGRFVQPAFAESQRVGLDVE